MTNTTATYWDIDGVSLNTYAHNITTLGGGRTNTPPLRGENVTVPYRRGQLYLPKTADSRDITLAMWVAGRKSDGTFESYSVQEKFEYNLNILRQLMWKEGSQVTLTKRFYRGGSIIEASAKAELTRGFAPDMDAPGYGHMSLTFELADPFFYGDEVEVEIEEGTETVTIDGDTFTNNIQLDLPADATLVNQTATPDIGIHTNVAATVDVYTKLVSGLSANGLIETSGSSMWFVLFPGENDLLAVGGDATIRYRPAYF